MFFDGKIGARVVAGDPPLKTFTNGEVSIKKSWRLMNLITWVGRQRRKSCIGQLLCRFILCKDGAAHDLVFIFEGPFFVPY